MESVQRRKPLLRTAGYAACLSFFAACGEPDSTERTPGSSAASYDVSGVVVDGYLEGATVFADLNGNRVLDDAEPHAVTDAKGFYRLSLSESEREQLEASFLYAIVHDSAKDLDDHGKTLKEAGKASFTLVAPVSAPVLGDAGVAASVVISPLSALVSVEMMHANVSVEEAEIAVRSRLGLAGKSLLQDFVAAADPVLANVARTAAVSLGEASLAQEARFGDGGVAMTKAESLVATLSTVQTRLPQVVATLGQRTSTAQASLEEVKTAWNKHQGIDAVADAGLRSAGDAAILAKLDDTSLTEPVRIEQTWEREGDTLVINHPGATPSLSDAGLTVTVPVPDLKPSVDGGVIKVPDVGLKTDASVTLPVNVTLPVLVGNADAGALITLQDASVTIKLPL